MSTPRLQAICHCVIALYFLISAHNRAACQEPVCVHFDVPRQAVARDVSIHEGACDSPGQKYVQIDIPVSTRLGCPQNQPVVQVLVELRAIGRDVQIVDFSPRTVLYSEFEGPISIEEKQENKISLGLNLESGILAGLNLGGEAGTSTLNGRTEKYNRIPEQQILLASGTLERGRGVYFKFNQTSQSPLEGDHPLSLTLAVPQSWRGGLIRVDCRAVAEKKSFLGAAEELGAGRSSFVVATWLQGDGEAYEIAREYVAREMRLREEGQAWNARQGSRRNTRTASFRWGSAPAEETSLPAGWTAEFMLYDSRMINSRIRPHLSGPLRESTDQYLAARHELLNLGRAGN